MARKFKRKLAPKTNRKSTQKVLSVEFIRKETLEKFKQLLIRFSEIFKQLRKLSN